MPSPGKGRFMQLRYQMNDILPLLPVPQPPYGKTAYNIPCPICDAPGSRGQTTQTAEDSKNAEKPLRARRKSHRPP